MPTEKIEIPIPRMEPFGVALHRPENIQELWDVFVKPEQDAGIPQSIEMRALMAVLRAVYQGLIDANITDDEMPT